MKKIILFTSLLSSLSYAEVPGTPPDWWCRAEAVSPNGDDYLRFAKTAEAACAKAVKDCEDHYGNCEITGCGEWRADLNVFEGFCNEMNKS